MKPRAKKIKKVLLSQPNYAWLSKRTWQFPPYTLSLLMAAIKGQVEALVFDPNFHNLSQDETAAILKKVRPDLVGVTSVSTEYFEVTRQMLALVRKALPEAVIVFGGVIPTVMTEQAMKDKNVDYWVIGEGEYSLPQLIEKLNSGSNDFSDISGLAYWKDGKPVINKTEFIGDLDALPFPDYSEIIGATLHDYGNIKFKYVPNLLTQNYPSAVTITSRGCPYRCIFCAGRTVSGAKVRFRSAENVLKEIDELYQQGIREVIFLDDHFLANRDRAMKIMQGILDNYKGLTWRCVNVTAWLLDEELLKLMYKSGCTHITVSIESGNQRVLTDIVKKPINLKKIPEKLDLAKSIGFDVIANFVVGFPGETWEEIRDTFRYAEKLNIDIVNFHIATPLPNTELMDICLREKLLPQDHLENISNYSGYGKGMIATRDFTSFELEVLRSFEWDRINFSTPERRKNIARMNGITLEELEDWRMNTRRNLGVNSLVKNIMTSTGEKRGKGN
ncbi:MAG: radical SAM protein [Candidatus Omnitrophica bacterium]|nr:radical SAM protein [Candidatus Omnitrophota bacterium]